ncbi:tetratricopeptide (TPR) repeat protein [Rhodococcus sp. 27YEA15]|uniref:SEC-C metal-binding domain-containing protein n=1 Tax=Rhodococcus sp. 27YEA15 TaxID=3156259 RepID=UPI003C7EB8F0
MNDFDDNALATAAMAVLRERGPLSLEQWAHALGEYGSPADVGDMLDYLSEPMLGRLPGGRCLALDTTLEGLVFTHRLSAPEIASDVLAASPDLEPLLAFGEGVDAEIQVVVAEFETDMLLERGAQALSGRRVVVLPSGTLDGHCDGDLIGIAVEDGQLACRPVDIEDDVDLTPILAGVVGEGGVEALDSLCWQLAIEDPTLFTVPIAPLTELFDTAGYVHRRELLARRGFDFDAYDVQLHTASVASTYGLTHDEAIAAVAFVDLADRGYTDAAIDGLDIADWARRHIGASPDSFVSLADPGAAVAVFDLGFRAHDPVSDTVLEALAVELAERGPRAVRAAAHWLAGKAADRLGRVLEAEGHYEKAITESDWGPALFELAQFASDRGDSTRALSLLGRIDGGTEEDLYAVLQEVVPAEHPELGRNDKCWCGSERKYKVCHLGKADESVKSDGRWLYKKACLFAFASEFVDTVTGLDEISTEHLDDVELITRTIFDGPALDVALFEGGILTEFVARRGALLSESDAAIAADWVGASRDVYDVVDVVANRATLRRHNSTGEVTAVLAGPFEQVSPGDVVCTRILPTPLSALAVGTVVLASEQQVAAVGELLKSGEPVDAGDVVRACRAPLSTPGGW